MLRSGQWFERAGDGDERKTQVALDTMVLSCGHENGHRDVRTRVGLSPWGEPVARLLDAELLERAPRPFGRVNVGLGHE